MGHLPAGAQDARWAGSPTREAIEADPFLADARAVAVPPPPAVNTPGNPALVPTFSSYAYEYLEQLTPLAPSALLRPPWAGSRTECGVVPAGAALSYAEFLGISRRMGVMERCGLWFLVARDEKTGERAGVVRKRRMKLQERLRKEAWKLLTEAEVDRIGQTQLV